MTKSLQERGFREGHTVGDTIRQLYKFINEGNCSPDFMIVSPAEIYEEMPAKDFFGSWGRKNCKPMGYMIIPKRLQWISDIRAIVSRGRKKISIETSKLDLEKLSQSNGFEKLGVDIQGRQIFHKGEKIIQTYTKNAARLPLVDVRTISTFLPDYGDRDLDMALDTVDHIFNYNCFEETSQKHSPQALVTAQKLSQVQLLTQEMRQELRQSLDVIQVPKLIMGLQQNPYLVARTAFKARILQMNNTELNEYLRQVGN